MSENSPLFVSSMELISHSIDLYTEGNAKKYKFVILHLANAVELILKDKVIDTGQSIYKDNNKLTIGIWECFKSLESQGVSIPERPVIELLIDDRNTIQHRFGFPNSESVYFYLKSTLEFFQRFLQDEYNINMAEVLLLHTSEENLELVGVRKRQETETRTLERLYEISPESAVLKAYNLLEERFSPYLSEDGRKGKLPVMLWHHADFNKKLKDLIVGGFLADGAHERFQELRQARNMASHSQHYGEVPIENWREALDIGIELLSGVEKAIKSGLLKKNESTEVETHD